MAFVPSVRVRHMALYSLLLHLIVSYTIAWSPLYSGSTASSSTESSNKDATAPWYPRRIQESVDYKQVVPSAHVRQIVVETKEMAKLAVELYLESKEEDPFASVADQVNILPEKQVGWIESTSNYTDGILPQEVQAALFELSPKMGDVHILPSDIGQYHVVKVDELAVLHRPNSVAANDGATPIGGHSGINAILPRSKLKGQGVTPTLPDSPKTYLIHTAGCQMNVADTERLAGVLEKQLGLTPSTTPKEADVVIFNTCTIRDHAEQKVFDALGPYAAQKRKGKQFALVVTGCVAQQEGELLLRRVPEVDVVLGPQYVPHLQNVLESVEWGHQVVATSPIIQQQDLSKPIRGHDLKAYVNIIFGCNEHCTYCVVPAVRGMEQSRPMESILDECMSLVKDGYKEITLLGQNIDAYGRDMVPKRTFATLLEYLNENLRNDKIRIRCVTSHPRYFSDRVIDAVADLPLVCECFHMPFQAGDNDVLKNMRRGYTYESYMNIIHKIRAKAPDASICGDVIVGFPGETDAAFQRTLDLMKEVKFDNLNTFAYSPRPNTEAALWDNQVPEEIKSERLQMVQALAAKHGMERSQRYVGRTVEVLVEDGNPRNTTQCMGRTRQGRQVFFDGDLSELRGTFVYVRITEARAWSLMGDLLVV